MRLSGTSCFSLCSEFDGCFEVLLLLEAEDWDSMLHSPGPSFVHKHLAFNEGNRSLPLNALVPLCNLCVEGETPKLGEFLRV